MTRPARERHRTLVALALALACAGCGTTSSGPAAPTSASPSGAAASAILGSAVLEAFAALTQRDGLTFHLEQTASMAIDGTASGGATYALDVAGKDFAGVIDAAGQRINITWVNGRTWLSTDGRTWSEGKALDAATVADIVGPWRYLGPIDALVLVRTDSAGLHFANGSPVEYQTSAMKAQGLSGAVDSMDFLVQADGRPVRLALHATASPATGELAGKRFETTTTILFSKVGEALPIAPPK